MPVRRGSTNPYYKFIETMTSRSERLLRLVALFCFGAVGVALISQHAFDMPPCAWCVMQRLIYLVIGVVALVGGFGGGRALTRVCGAGRAAGPGGRRRRLVPVQRGRQDAVLRPDLRRPLHERRRPGRRRAWLFGIYATCMDAVVSVLGVEYALWSLALFVVVLLLSLRAAFGRGRA